MMHETTMKRWRAEGRQLVEAGQVESVRIMDRRPRYIRDSESVDGGYGWMYGWRWEDDTATAAATLPEAVFLHLEDCPNHEVVRRRKQGHGVAPRWPTESEALAALDRAAYAWAASGPEA